MYRQVTVYGNGNPYHGNFSYEYDDVLAAWRDYMAHYNDGRGVVLIGHSEGAGLFTRLIEDQIERSPVERRLLVSAILLGDVTVKDGSTEGGSFTGVPACTSTTETGCVVAYSAWSRTPPADAAEQSVSNRSEHVLCVNPAAPGSTSSTSITPIFVGQVPEGIVPLRSAYDRDLFVVFPDLYTARCVQQGTRAWLLVTRTHHPGDRRPTVQPILGPEWGLHAADVNIALANLVSLVGSESRTWLKHR
jgi:pimeloyl-ACP methyl ester carboxylesterase